MATTIVETRTASEVVIATDSVGTFVSGAKLPDKERPVCKLYRVGGIFFAVAGLVDDPNTGFNIPKIVAEEFRYDRSADDAREAVETRLKAALPEELQRIRGPGLVPKSGLTEGITILVAAIENGIPTAMAIHFALPPSGPLPEPVHHVCPADDTMCVKGRSLWWAGQADTIKRRPVNIDEFGDPDLARDLVQLEIDAGAPGVGGPVDVLRLLPSGPVYEPMKSGCPTVAEP